MDLLMRTTTNVILREARLSSRAQRSGATDSDRPGRGAGPSTGTTGIPRCARNDKGARNDEGSRARPRPRRWIVATAMMLAAAGHATITFATPSRPIRTTPGVPAFEWAGTYDLVANGFPDGLRQAVMTI